MSLLTGAAVVLIYGLTVGTRTGQLLSGVMLGGRPASPESVATAEQVLSNLSRSTLVIGTLAIIGIGLLRRRPRLALVATATVVGANLTTQVLKQFVLDRADLSDGVFYSLPNSFPSGHATAAASIAVALLLVLPPLLRGPSVGISAIVVAIVGISTLVTGWHRMADAVGGVFVATSWGAGLAAVLASRRGFEGVGPRLAELGRFSTTVPLLIGIAVLITGGTAYLIAAADPLDVLLYLAERGGSPALFVVGAAITVGASLLALGALAYALRDIRLDPQARGVQ